MTTFEANSVDELLEHDSWGLLASVTLGRLATNVADQPEIFPVNFVVQQRTILLRTGEGTKLSSAMANVKVAFEADDHTADEGWSVVVKGRAYALGESEFAEAERAQVMPWITTPKIRFIRIVPSEISGRRFRFGGERERTDRS